MQRIILISFLYLLTVTCFGRDIETVDTVRYRFSYDAKLAMYDKPLLLPDEVNVDIGKQVTHCYSRWDEYNTTLQDSLYAVGYDNDEYHEKAMPNCHLKERDIKNYPKKGVMTVTSIGWIKTYLFEEPIEDKKWQLQNGDTTILGYPCKKASCKFRGRTWNVWYTLNIPISEGPWKLDGLPGMILKAVDSCYRFSFECIGIKENVNEPMKCRFTDPLKTTAQKVYELRKLQYTNYRAFAKSTGLDKVFEKESLYILDTFPKTEPFLMEYYDK